VTNKMPTETASTSLFKKLFDPSSVWDCGSLIDGLGSNNPISTIIKIAYSLAAILFAIQILVIAFRQIRSGGESLAAELLGHLARLGIYVLLIKGYTLLIKLIVWPANMIATQISKVYINSFTSSWVALFEKGNESGGGVLGILKVTMDGSLISSVIASIVYFIASLCAFITPLIQQALFMLAYFLGPICIAFMLCDFTVDIFKRWFSMAMSIAYIGVIGSCTFLVAGAMNIYAYLGEQPGIDNVVMITVYGIISILLFASAFPIAQFLFGGAGMGNLTNPLPTLQAAGQGAGSAALLALGAGAGAASVGGAALQKMAPAGSWMSRTGDVLRSSGGFVSDKLHSGSDINSRSMMPRSAGALSIAQSISTMGDRLANRMYGGGNKTQKQKPSTPTTPTTPNA